MNVRGFLKNVLNQEGKETQNADGESTENASPSASGMSSFLSGTSRFLDSVQTKKNGLINDISHKLSAIKLPGDQSTGDSVNKEENLRTKRPAVDEDDGDSSASEYGNEGDRPMYAEETPMERQVSVESVDSLPENEANQWRGNIRAIIREVLCQKSVSSEAQSSMENYAMRHTGRSGFAKELKVQVGSEKKVPLPVLNGLAQLMKPILTQCNETDDFLPATHLMQISFTLYHETPAANMNDRGQLHYLYSLLRDQTIWQSMRFWNAAFFTTLQRKRSRQTIPAGFEGEEALRMEREMHDNTTYMELSKFVWRMFALGINKESCMDFLRKQSNTANLSKGKITRSVNFVHQGFCLIYLLCCLMFKLQGKLPLGLVVKSN
ncbi:hypothetical protein FGIG_07781 [Fasciola gigantica]|uniref:SBF1/SBF2 domain-containing protein n=1 Tax=Fasciola gigantica TaxID=46835 RepID=A0A504YX16_FASGI|nr:hypothetical protein FGIG_07781 [Fasciola gigantica]